MPLTPRASSTPPRSPARRSSSSPIPSDPKWEATVNGGSPLLSAAEIDAIEAFVSAGGGLVVLGETEQDKYGNNLNELLARFGVTIENATVQDYSHHFHDTPSWVLASLGDSLEGGARPLCRRRLRPARRRHERLLLPLPARSR